MQDSGVPMSHVEVQNEPAINAAIQYASPEDLRDAALALIDQLDRNGLSHVMLHGPNYHMPPETADWAEVWLADDTLRARTAAVSYHTWWSETFEDYDGIREVAGRYGKPVWATEIGRWADAERLQPSTWPTAWDTAMSFYRAIAWSRASRLYHWTSLGHDAIVSTSGERYPTFYTVKHFANFIPPGAVFLESASGDTEVLALCFLLPDGSLSAILLNTGGSEKTMWLSSVAGGTLAPAGAVTTSEGSYEAATAVGGPDGEGRISVTLPPQSITSLGL
jgi:O-glycosyl hydrolase